MSYQAEALERTKLKFLGVYLQYGGPPVSTCWITTKPRRN